MKIPREAELNTNLDVRRRTIEVAYLGDEGVDEELVIGYGRQRCLSNPDTMRVITHVLDTAGVPVPMPAMTTQQMMKCPPARRLQRSWYVTRPCSPSLAKGVAYEFYLSTSCSELPDFDGSFWNLDPRQARQHERHLSGHHGLNGTVTLIAANEALSRSKQGSIRLSRHEGGDRACGRD